MRRLISGYTPVELASAEELTADTPDQATSNLGDHISGRTGVIGALVAWKSLENRAEENGKRGLLRKVLGAAALTIVGGMTAYDISQHGLDVGKYLGMSPTIAGGGTPLLLEEQVAILEKNGGDEERF